MDMLTIEVNEFKIYSVAPSDVKNVMFGTVRLVKLPKEFSIYELSDLSVK
jgi:hypothetical protein